LIDGHFSFVPFVSFVFKMGSPLKTVEPETFRVFLFSACAGVSRVTCLCFSGARTAVKANFGLKYRQ